MSNKDQAFGLEPYPAIIVPTIDLYCDSSASTIRRGDPVIKESDGGINLFSAITQIPFGVAAGYHLTGTAGYIAVNWHPYQMYIIQEDGEGTTSALTHQGNVADLIITETPNGKQSAFELDISSVGTTATPGTSKCLRIISLANGCPQDPDNAWGAHAKLLVMFAFTQLNYVDTNGYPKGV